LTNLVSLKAAYAAVFGLAFMTSAFEAKSNAETDSFTGSVTFASDYVYRGISQSSSQAAYTGTAEYSHAITSNYNVFVGGFISNVDFSDGDLTNVEVSPSVGIEGQKSEFSWRILAYYDIYPGAPSRVHYNYYGFDTNFSRDFGLVQLSFEAGVDPNLFGNSGTGVYAGLDATIPLPNIPLAPNIVLHSGRQSIERNAFYQAPDYVDWALELNADIQSVHLALRYSDTDIPRPQCFGGSRVCGERVVVSLGWTF